MQSVPHDLSVKDKTRIAGFDMDWTLIKTKTGATFPKNKEDWVFLYSEKTMLKL